MRIDGKEHCRQDGSDAERNGLSMAAENLELVYRLTYNGDVVWADQKKIRESKQ